MKSGRNARFSPMRLHRDPEDYVVTRDAGASSAADPCAKFAAARRWVNRHLGTTRHEDRVIAIATNLFDLTLPLHGLTRASRRLLRLGAIVHDVGRCISKKAHPSDGAAMLAADATLPLAPAERRALAYFTLHHRGAVPALGR